MRAISTGVAAAFLFASTFASLAAPAALKAPAGPAAITVQDTAPQGSTAQAQQPEKRMHRKSAADTKRHRQRTSMHHRRMAHRKTAMHRKTSQRTKTAPKSQGGSAY